MQTSDETKDLIEALSKAQGEIKPAPKDADNPFFKSRYATLDSCWKAIRDPLAKNGLAIIQAPGFDGGQLTLTTRLAHSSGQWIETTLAVEPEKSTIQAMGSTITYLRRYSLALVGLTTDEDDDGNDTGETKPAAVPKQNGTQQIMTADLLLARLNKEADIAGYYKDAKHVYNAMKKELGSFEWPDGGDMDSWKETFDIALNRAKAQKETTPEQPALVDVPADDQHTNALTEG